MISELNVGIDESVQEEDGPIKIIEQDKIPKEPKPMIDGFEWVTMNLEDEKEVSLLPLSPFQFTYFG